MKMIFFMVLVKPWNGWHNGYPTMQCTWLDFPFLIVFFYTVLH